LSEKNSNFDLVVITGAAGAIGCATVTRFLQAGYSVIGIDREASGFGSAANYEHIQLQIADSAQLSERLRASSRGREIHHFISIAGGALPAETTHLDPMDIEDSTFSHSLQQNLTTQFVAFRAVLPFLREAKQETSVTFTSSFNALSGWGMPAYSAAKAGVIGMMHALVMPLGAHGTRVNVVAPGTILTPRTERIWRHEKEHFAKLKRGSAVGRLGTPDDVASVYFALATLLTYVTGQVLVVDGGQMTVRNVA
jgi:NAD(P)-dependent dehydrogenase (short-subunit alcohol dehydrogenase family)